MRNKDLKYNVISVEDGNKYLTPAEAAILMIISDRITSGRKGDGLKPMDCFVLENDGSEYYKDTRESILAVISPEA